MDLRYFTQSINLQVCFTKIDFKFRIKYIFFSIELSVISLKLRTINLQIIDKNKQFRLFAVHIKVVYCPHTCFILNICILLHSQSTHITLEPLGIA